MGSKPNPLAVLNERKKALRRELEQICTTAESENRDLTAEEQGGYDTKKAEFDRIAKHLERRVETTPPNRMDELLASFVDDGPWPGESDEARERRLLGSSNCQLTKSSAAGQIGHRFKTLFPGVSLSTDGWSSRQEFLSTIHSGMSHPRLMAMTEGTGAGGGFLVPTQYAAEMLDAMMENSIVMPRARVYPMTTEKMKIAGFDSSTNTAGTLFGGIDAQWIGESDTGTATNPKVRKIELTAKKLALFTSSSNELAEDGLNLDSQLSTSMSEANSWFLDYAFLRGTGAGQPLGVLNDPALITVNKATVQDADSLVYENLCDMLGRLHPGCFDRAVWVANPTCIPELLQLSQPIGTGGVTVPVMRETDGGFSIFTKPILFTEKLPTLGDKGDIILADFSQYAVGLRREITLEKSMHIRFMQDEVVWRAITRIDGQGRWNKAFTPANGVTQSWVVALEART